MTLTKGKTAIWRDENSDINEIEQFDGIDADNLHSIPAFYSIRTGWPLNQGGTSIEYNVEVNVERSGGGEVQAVVDNHETRNLKLAARHEVDWGTNTIDFRRVNRTGRCSWLRLSTKQPE